MQYSRKVHIYRREIVNLPDGQDSNTDILLASYYCKIKYNSGVVRKYNQNSNLSEYAQDLTVAIPKKISIEILTQCKHEGYITIDGTSYLINNFIISDVINTTVIYCRQGSL